VPVIDKALWYSVRVLEESADLVGRLATGAETRGHASVAESYRASERSKRHKAMRVRDLIEPKS
jgi:hypothetical protein